MQGYTSGGCFGPVTTNSQLWDGRGWRSRPYTYRDLKLLACPTDVANPVWLDPGEEAAYPRRTRAPGVYRINHSPSALGLSVTAEVLGCRCPPDIFSD